MKRLKLIIKSNNETVRIVAKSSEEIFEIFCDLNENVLNAGRTQDKEYFLQYEKSIMNTKEFQELLQYYDVDTQEI